MTIRFPSDFIFGTSTSAYQIESSFQHDWKGIKSRDGYIFDRTTDHEMQHHTDVAIISSLAPNYRMSLMWSRLQREPYGSFDKTAVAEYHSLLKMLKARNVTIMMVIHHWVNPVWFCERGGWERKESTNIFLDFARKLVDEFGNYVSYWNTFNEPNLYVTLSHLVGEFPPYKRDFRVALKVIKNMSSAHEILYDYIKEKHPKSLVGISHNCVAFSAENMLGRVPAKIADYWYMEYLPRHFKASDFFGLSYYARLSFDPSPITYLYTPKKLEIAGKPHDDIWEYYPQGLDECVRRYWTEFEKPIIITENGICTKDDSMRVKSIKDYMTVIANLIQDKVDVRGYYHWSAWDNFEWNLGPTYQFGLYSCDPDTKIRTKKPSADLFSKLAYSCEIEV
jgi:beta-glucosidase